MAGGQVVTGVVVLARGECVLCEEPFTYRDDGRGQRNICDPCIEYIRAAARQLR